MARQVSTFIIGLFVTAGIVIGVSIIVWIGASRYFEKGTLYATYFDESVQGLQRDSLVKYRGVDAGRIVTIAVAPDNRLIEVVMKIDLTDDLEKNAVAQLKAVGLTGIVFIELDRRDPTAADVSPKIDFSSEYPVIPSKPSEVRQILTGIDKVIDKINTVDFQGISDKINSVDFRGISDQIKATGKSADNLLAGNRMKLIMANLESSTAAFNKSMAEMEKVMSRSDVERTIGEARQTLADIRALISGFRSEVIDKISKVDFQGISEQIRTSAKSVNDLVDGSRMNRVMANLESSTAALDRAMAGIEKIISTDALAGTLTEARQSLRETRLLISQVKDIVNHLKLVETAETTKQMMESLARSTRESAVNIQRATENLKTASESLERLMERLEAKPSDLLFSK